MTKPTDFSPLARGGRVLLPEGDVRVREPLCLTASSARLSGETWAYASDPNGVFEGSGGAKLRRAGNGFPLLSVGAAGLVSGGVSADNLGFFGDIAGMDTRPLFDPLAASPAPDAGLYFGGGRVDQGHFSRLSFGGLGAGIYAGGGAELDACTFEALNLDGCAVGVYFAPRASYYTRFSRSVIADNPYFGLIAVGGAGRNVHNLDISENLFVRNGGALPAEMPGAAAVVLRGVNGARVRDNLFDAPGTFWFYPEEAARNEDRQPMRRPLPALRVSGDRCVISGNVFRASSAESAIVEGDGNVLLGNVADGDVIVRGDGCTVSGLAFTSPAARLRIHGHCTVTGVDPARIVEE